MKVPGAILCLAALAAAENPAWRQAQPLYQSTRYTDAIKLLENQSDTDAQQLLGQCLFQLDEFKKATEVFEKALAQAPDRSDLHLWLGRAWGRRAETSNPLMAPRYATRARQAFEKAIELNSKNLPAMSDLFEYYLQAPGFLGGGKDKAAALAARIAQLDQAEGHFVQAALAEDRKDHAAAEKEFRTAITAAPNQVGRVLDLAKFLARRGRIEESDAEFQRAAKMAPGSPKVLFDRASTLIETKRNRDEARALLRQYLEASLTPDDAPRKQAEKLLRGL